MKHARTVVLLTALSATVGCTKENAAFCCLTAEDCAAKGVDELRMCADGLSCVSNTCVAPTCTTNGCGAATPVCDITTDQCVGCTESTQCSIFTSSPVCDTASGGCVECTAPADCSGTRPICEANACRACALDTECPSGACAEDGACVPESAAIYLSPTGTDALPCSRQAPCKTLAFGIQQTSATKSHIVLTTGTYLDTAATAGGTTAPLITLHGHGALLRGGNADAPVLRTTAPMRIANLSLYNDSGPDGIALVANAATRLERVQLEGDIGLRNTADGPVIAHDLEVVATRASIVSTGSLTLDRAELTGGATGIDASFNTLELTSVLIHHTTGIAITLNATTGSITFITIAMTGTADLESPGIRCLTPQQIRSSIIWTRTTTNRPTIDGPCTFASSIVGPNGVAGAENRDPLFLAPQSDFHLSLGSPARDLAETGPSTDIDGDSRPQGPRFDIGADEAP